MRFNIVALLALATFVSTQRIVTVTTTAPIGSTPTQSSTAVQSPSSAAQSVSSDVSSALSSINSQASSNAASASSSVLASASSVSSSVASAPTKTPSAAVSNVQSFDIMKIGVVGLLVAWNH
ncbi:hypothetical protein K7432_011562 [Basidiobolus ranarum]|uniref:Uncharacterized protein n=1 Tax=Basidiobolus ranarum TaxID=34480 RepID=A0ABR2VTS3_9FUNG